MSKDKNGKSQGDKLRKANQMDNQAKGNGLVDDDGFTRVDDNFEKFEFKIVGDTLKGYFTGFRTITPNEGEEFRICTFWNPDNGSRFSTPANHQLVKTLEKESEMTTTMYKITYVSDTKVTNGSMKNFQILRKPNCEAIPQELVQTM